MDDSTDIFFALLRSGLYGTPIPDRDLPDVIDWDAIIALARRQTVLGIIIEAINLLPQALRPTGTLADSLNHTALALIRSNLVLDHAVARVAAFYASHNIPGVLLKGQGVARYYRDPRIRQCGDVDFYVGREAYPRAVSLTISDIIGDPARAGEETDQHFGFRWDGVAVELHRLASRVYSPIPNRRFQAWVTDELLHSPERRTIVLNNTPVTLPSYNFDAIFIFYHAWRHFIMGGIGLRQLCDWAMIFHSHAADIDRSRLVADIRRFGMTKGWKLFAAIAVTHLGVSSDLIPLYNPAYLKKSEKILAEILSGGNFGYYSRANTRTPFHGSGLAYGLGKARNITGYFFSLFPLIPLEATFLYFNRLYTGIIANTKRSKNRPAK